MDRRIYKRMRADPLYFAHLCWPEVKFYDKQIEMIYSVRDNLETFVVAGNKLGGGPLLA